MREIGKLCMLAFFFLENKLEEKHKKGKRKNLPTENTTKRTVIHSEAQGMLMNW